MVERRLSFRRRTYLGARIEIPRLNGWATECIVRDLNATGARIAVGTDVVLPPVFEIAVSGDAPQPVRMVWYRGGHAGVTPAEQALQR